MKDKMVLSCLKLKQNGFLHLWRERFKYLRQFGKIEKIVKQIEETVSAEKISYC